MHLIICFGISGSGKSTFGAELSALINSRGVLSSFVEADEFHSIENREKMRKGISLEDSDRLPWLSDITHHITTNLLENKFVVLACSALKKMYRDILRSHFRQTTFILLDCSNRISVIRNRLIIRKGHFVNELLLESQLKTLEIPEIQESDAIILDTTADIKQNQQIIMELLFK